MRHGRRLFKDLVLGVSRTGNCAVVSACEPLECGVWRALEISIRLKLSVCHHTGDGVNAP